MKLTLFYMGETRVCVDPAVLLPAFLAFVTGNGGIFMTALVSLILHEAAHTAVAYACSARVSAIVIHPLGMRAELEERGKNTAGAMLIAAAGPLFSLLAGIIAHTAAEAGLTASGLVEQFAAVNCTVAIANLLPAPPLDGAELLRNAVTARAGAKKAGVTLFIIGTAASAAFVYLAVKHATAGDSTPYAYACAALLFALEAINALCTANRARTLQNKRSAIRRRGSMEVRQMAVSARMPVREALKLASGAGYVRFIVLDDELREIASFGEGEVYLRSADAGGAGVTFYELIYSRLRPQ